MSGIDAAKKRILANVPLEKLIGETVKLTKKGETIAVVVPSITKKHQVFTYTLTTIIVSAAVLTGTQFHLCRNSKDMDLSKL